MRKHEISFVRRQEIVYTPEKFEHFCSEFRTLCLQNKHEALLRRFQIIELIDRLKYQKATSEQAKQAFEKLFEHFMVAKDYSAALSCLLEASLGFYPTQVESLKVLFFAEKFAEKHHLEKDIALQSVYHMIGFYLWELNIYALSNQYFKKSLKTGYSIPSDSLRALNGVGINCQKLQDFKTSNQYFEQASRYALHIKNNLFNTVIEGNKAVNFFKMGEWEKAHELAIRYKNVSLQHELWDNAFGALYWLAQIALAQKQPEKAKIWVDSLEVIKNKVQKKDSKLLLDMRQKEAIYLYEKSTQNPTTTLLAYQAYIKADSAFQAVAHKSKISEIKLKAEVELYAQEMATKEQERQASWSFFYLVISVLLSFTFVLIGFFSRRGKKQRQEIQYLKQQLFTQIQTINQQNEAIQTIIPPQNIPQEHENETLEFDAERMQVKETDIQYLRNFNLAYKEQWSSFKESFLRIYPNFEHRLQEKIGTLSNAELRLLMLHKLGLNNTEIAKSLLISPESVRTGKYRLYKKFGISSNEELDKIL